MDSDYPCGIFKLSLLNGMHINFKFYTLPGTMTLRNNQQYRCQIGNNLKEKSLDL